jgi:hypothetical protein
MHRLSRSDLEAHVDSWDAVVERDDALDPFCARSAWQLSYHDAFAPERPLWLACEDGAVVVLAERADPAGAPVLESLENMWGLSPALLGPAAGELLARSLVDEPVAVLLSGLPFDRKRFAPLLRALEGRYSVRAFESSRRFVASLDGGIDGWLARRSRSFRRSLRGSLRRVADHGIEFRCAETSDVSRLGPLYDRVLAIEARSWKGAAGNGANVEPMSSFYRLMWPRLAAAGQLRLLFAERDGKDLGYLHGGLVGSSFRGLQFSFDDELRDAGLGNALQFEMLKRLCDEGATDYDLGSRSEYKSRWAEQTLQSVGLYLLPR